AMAAIREVGSLRRLAVELISELEQMTVLGEAQDVKETDHVVVAVLELLAVDLALLDELLHFRLEDRVGQVLGILHERRGDRRRVTLYLLYPAAHQAHGG